MKAFLGNFLSCLMPVQINPSSLPVLGPCTDKIKAFYRSAPAESSRVFYLFYILQRELTLLQTDGSCSSLTLGMTIHGLVCA